MRGRKKGCPTSVKDWQISIHHPVDDRWVRILGLNSITRGKDSTTEDGSDTSSAHEEPYVKKRSGSLSLEGKAVVNEVSGERDEGQELLDEYAGNVYCEGDALIKITDAYGHSMQAYYVVTSSEQDSDSDGDTVSWDLSMVGEAESLPFVLLESISLTVDGEPLEALSIDMNDAPRLIAIHFHPENASNMRYRISTSGRIVRATGFSEGVFYLVPLQAGEATVKVSTVNNALEAVFSVTVTNDLEPWKSGVLGVGMLGAMVLGRSSLG